MALEIKRHYLRDNKLICGQQRSSKVTSTSNVDMISCARCLGVLKREETRDNRIELPKHFRPTSGSKIACGAVAGTKVPALSTTSTVATTCNECKGTKVYTKHHIPGEPTEEEEKVATGTLPALVHFMPLTTSVSPCGENLEKFQDKEHSLEEDEVTCMHCLQALGRLTDAPDRRMKLAKAMTAGEAPSEEPTHLAFLTERFTRCGIEINSMPDLRTVGAFSAVKVTCEDCLESIQPKDETKTTIDVTTVASEGLKETKVVDTPVPGVIHFGQLNVPGCLCGRVPDDDFVESRYDKESVTCEDCIKIMNEKPKQVEKYVHLCTNGVQYAPCGADTFMKGVFSYDYVDGVTCPECKKCAGPIETTAKKEEDKQPVHLYNDYNQIQTPCGMTVVDVDTAHDIDKVTCYICHSSVEKKSPKKVDLQCVRPVDEKPREDPELEGFLSSKCFEEFLTGPKYTAEQFDLYRSIVTGILGKASEARVFYLSKLKIQ